MSKRDIISAVLYRLGLATSIGGTAVLAYYNFGCPTVPETELNRVVTVVFFGMIMMLVSFALDFLPRKEIAMAKPGKWRITSQFIMGRKVYMICRPLDADKPLHSGNVECYDDMMYTDKASLQAIVNRLNAEEGS